MHFLREECDGALGPLDTTFQVTVKIPWHFSLLLILFIQLPMLNMFCQRSCLHAAQSPSDFLLKPTCHWKNTSKDEQKPDVSRDKNEETL